MVMTHGQHAYKIICSRLFLHQQSTSLLLQYIDITAVHRYRTRHASKNYFFHPRVNKARTQMSIKVRGAKLWNNLPVSLTEDKIKLGKQCFFKAAKKHFLSEL